MKKTILVTGIFGSIGHETLKELIRKKNKYIIIGLDIKNKKTLSTYKKVKDHLTMYWFDLAKKENMSHILSSVDYVIHLAAIIPPLADKNPSLAKSINVDGTNHLLSQLNKFAPTAFLIFSSSISVYGDRINNPYISITDSLLPSDGDYYAKTKILAERLVIKSSLNWTIFRLSAIMSPKAKMDPLFFHMPLNTCMEIATTRDTGYALVRAIEKQNQLNHQIFNLSGGKSCRVVYKNFLEKAFMLSKLGKFNLPKIAFAKKNFHCGYYRDADILQNILSFQRDSIDDYYSLYKKSISLPQSFFTLLFKRVIKKSLLKKSDPLASIKNNNLLLQHKFYGN
ncbi:MAG: NAD(P)-dependent oxidoreductase [Clostridiales bacterium]|nr:NAD(P)-dependent oxidoreductase [Clostridiales bacterium]